MKKIILLIALSVFLFSCSENPNQSPELLSKYFIQYAKNGDFLNIISQINYGDADKKSSSIEWWLKLSEEKLPNGLSKQVPLINYYKDKYKYSSVTEIDKISSEIAVIYIHSKSYVADKKFFTEPTFAGNFDGKWYIIGTKDTIDKDDYNAIGKSKATVIKKYILEKHNLYENYSHEIESEGRFCYELEKIILEIINSPENKDKILKERKKELVELVKYMKQTFYNGSPKYYKFPKYSEWSFVVRGIGNDPFPNYSKSANYNLRWSDKKGIKCDAFSKYPEEISEIFNFISIRRNLKLPTF